jgi:iron complex transport system ATP-binding protein
MPVPPDAGAEGRVCAAASGAAPVDAEASGEAAPDIDSVAAPGARVAGIGSSLPRFGGCGPAFRGGRARDGDGPILCVKGLCFSHAGGAMVVRDLSLDFRPGRHYVLAGPNGAGKSTALDLLSRLKVPEKGSVTVFGREAGSYPPAELARSLALAPQNFQFNFSFTVREIVSLGRRPYLGRWGRLTREDRRVVEGAIEFLNLGRLADKPVTALSGGEAQRVVLARTLAQSTPIVLLDEPTASLDVAQALDLMDRVRVLTREEGALVVTVTHDLHLAAVYADEMVFMKKGRLAAAGPTAETLNPGLLKEVFDAEAEVRPDSFSGGLNISFRHGSDWEGRLRKAM